MVPRLLRGDEPQPARLEAASHSRQHQLLPILAYCLDKKGVPVLGKPRSGPETANFLKNEAYLDITLVVPEIKALHDPGRNNTDR
jgi:hypothetical protein